MASFQMTTTASTEQALFRHSELDMAQGLATNVTTSPFFGRNGSVGTSYENVWSQGGEYPFLTVATTLECVSVSAQDDAAGLGAQSIFLEGLDENFMLATDILVTNGSGTSSASTVTFIRLNKATITEVGTYGGSNYNNITIQGNGGGAVLGRIGGEETIDTASYGSGVTELAMYSIPAEHTAYLSRFSVNVEGTKTADVILFCRPDIDNISSNIGPRILLFEVTNIADAHSVHLDSWLKLPGKTDVFFRAKAASTNTSVDIGWDLFLVHNET